jgi:hypothetical protein
MKRTELQSLINECIGEVLNEGKVKKKKLAIQEIKRIIAENELSEADMEEGKVGDIFKQAVGIFSKKDKEAAEKSLESAVKEYGGMISKEQRDTLMKNAKSYSYLGKFVVTKNSKGRKDISFEGESAAPKTGLGIQPGQSGNN